MAIFGIVLLVSVAILLSDCRENINLRVVGTTFGAWHGPGRVTVRCSKYFLRSITISAGCKALPERSDRIPVLRGHGVRAGFHIGLDSGGLCQHRYSLDYLVTASFMAAPGGLLMAKLIVPEKPGAGDDAPLTEQIGMPGTQASNVVKRWRTGPSMASGWQQALVECCSLSLL